MRNVNPPSGVQLLPVEVLGLTTFHLFPDGESITDWIALAGAEVEVLGLGVGVEDCSSCCGEGSPRLWNSIGQQFFLRYIAE